MASAVATSVVPSLRWRWALRLAGDETTRSAVASTCERYSAWEQVVRQLELAVQLGDGLQAALWPSNQVREGLFMPFQRDLRH